MSFVGKPNSSGSVLIWDGEKVVFETAVINLQSAYNNANNVKLTNPVTFEGDETVSDAKLQLIHTSPFEDDEGLRLSTAATAGAAAWLPIAAYDITDNKVFEVGTDTGSSYVAVTSTQPDGNSGYTFMNEMGTFMALDTTSNSLVFQKADEGYIDFQGAGQSTPVLRIDTTTADSRVLIGTYGTNNTLSVNGIDITPYSGSVIVPLGSTDNHTLLNFIPLLENNQYAMANVDVFATTLEMQSYDLMVNGSWKFFITMNKKDDTVSVAGITEIDHQQISGSAAIDSSNDWNVDLSSNGILFVNGNAANHKLAFGALITKLSVLDLSTGNIIK
mgnify:CR=1 FL=1